MRTQYGVEPGDILESLIALVQRDNVRVLGRSAVLLGVLVRARRLRAARSPTR